MADARYSEYSTLEVAEHQPHQDLKFTNNTHMPVAHPAYSTLEASPEFDHSRFSTLEPYVNPDAKDKSEKGAAGAAVDSKGSETQKEGNWKRKRVLGVPLLFLTIGLVVLVVVIGAVVGGVVASKSKAQKEEPEQQQSGTSATASPSITSATSTATTSTSATTSTTSTASLQDTWVTGKYEDTYTIANLPYFLTGWSAPTAKEINYTEVGLWEIGQFTEERMKWHFLNVSQPVQESYKDSPNWGTEGPTTLYKFVCRPNKEKVLGINLELADAVANSSGAKEVTMSMVDMVDMDNERQAGWYFRPLNGSRELKGEDIPWSIHNINLNANWRMGVRQSPYGAEMQLDDGKKADEPSYQRWNLQLPIG